MGPSEPTPERVTQAREKLSEADETATVGKTRSNMGKALPKTIYARVESDNDGTSYLLAYDRLVDCVEEDGPTVIGVYALEETKRIRKVVENVS